MLFNIFFFSISHFVFFRKRNRASPSSRRQIISLIRMNQLIRKRKTTNHPKRNEKEKKKK